MAGTGGQGDGGHGRRSRLSAYVALAKPGLTLMSVSTALAGALLAPGGTSDPSTLFLVAIGTLLTGGGSIVLNQYAERAYDARMERTRRRPLPAGLITPAHALLTGCLLAILGIGALLLTTWLAAVLALLTVSSYVFLYTPLKRRTHFATAVGGLPGALPPVIGWTAVTGGFATQAYVLFLVLFLWQMPHFLALGWMYREDYAAGGYRLLPSIDRTGKSTARIVMVYTCALLPASVLPFVLGMAGGIFLALDGLAWIAFFIPVYKLTMEVSDIRARRVFLASLIYVPAFFVSIGIDRLLGL